VTQVGDERLLAGIAWRWWRKMKRVELGCDVLEVIQFHMALLFQYAPKTAPMLHARVYIVTLDILALTSYCPISKVIVTETTIVMIYIRTYVHSNIT